MHAKLPRLFAAKAELPLEVADTSPQDKQSSPKFLCQVLHVFELFQAVVLPVTKSQA